MRKRSIQDCINSPAYMSLETTDARLEYLRNNGCSETEINFCVPVPSPFASIKDYETHKRETKNKIDFVIKQKVTSKNVQVTKELLSYICFVNKVSFEDVEKQCKFVSIKSNLVLPDGPFLCDDNPNNNTLYLEQIGPQFVCGAQFEILHSTQKFTLNSGSIPPLALILSQGDYKVIDSVVLVKEQNNLLIFDIDLEKWLFEILTNYLKDTDEPTTLVLPQSLSKFIHFSIPKITFHILTNESTHLSQVVKNSVLEVRPKSVTFQIVDTVLKLCSEYLSVGMCKNLESEDLTPEDLFILFKEQLSIPQRTVLNYALSKSPKYPENSLKIYLTPIPKPKRDEMKKICKSPQFENMENVFKMFFVLKKKFPEFEDKVILNTLFHKYPKSLQTQFLPISKSSCLFERELFTKIIEELTNSLKQGLVVIPENVSEFTPESIDSLLFYEEMKNCVFEEGNAKKTSETIREVGQSNLEWVEFVKEKLVGVAKQRVFALCNSRQLFNASFPFQCLRENSCEPTNFLHCDDKYNSLVLTSMDGNVNVFTYYPKVFDASKEKYFNMSRCVNDQNINFVVLLGGKRNTISTSKLMAITQMVSTLAENKDDNDNKAILFVDEIWKSVIKKEKYKETNNVEIIFIPQNLEFFANPATTLIGQFLHFEFFTEKIGTEELIINDTLFLDKLVTFLTTNKTCVVDSFEQCGFCNIDKVVFDVKKIENQISRLCQTKQLNFKEESVTIDIEKIEILFKEAVLSEIEKYEQTTEGEKTVNSEKWVEALVAKYPTLEYSNLLQIVEQQTATKVPQKIEEDSISDVEELSAINVVPQPSNSTICVNRYSHSETIQYIKHEPIVLDYTLCVSSLYFQESLKEWDCQNQFL
ncbi:hypothetical protein EIN_411470 [Entamoeba invadens IP1]|uniref:Uncharacterized protein n=1 Tax=Entamoeba invadens IP1 TaxID=370355 RepID=A0A0A1U743_ENTIV|nr:hypothetical protein EIN_411470 [Entamoeba invadens IP1]ELP87794.1 hypothetical protein EIN_411470 [Entamoeba invadens IP1]|eukprot:XP_004254565.1 hypothetical protein EIN_411470 [Entamoeba invadens IP1]